MEYSGEPALNSFSERELEILGLIADGLSNQQIALKLFLTAGTVKWYNRQIFSKLSVGNRTEAAARARDLGLLDADISSNAPEGPRRSESATKYNLPLQTTPFIGRESELADLAGLLNDPAVRLATIVGPGGIGKTRLALQAAAAQLPRFTNGVYFAPLAPLASAENIVVTICDALGIQFYSSEDLRRSLLDYLRARSMLLVLDNFEHLLDGVDIARDIIAVAPGVKILATSRERLNLSGEVVFSIDGMPVPPSETSVEVLEYSAVRLFIQSARRVRRGFELEIADLPHVARICRLVEGMPLAIVLAAAWVNVLSPEEIAQEISQGLDVLQADMRDVPPRHHSIRAVLARSWDMLSEREQQAFSRLSVFRGGCWRHAAQAISGADLRILQGLVNKSLLRRNRAGRYEIHELLRQYSWEQLEASGDADAIRDAHSTYYLSALRERELDLKGRRQLGALNEIESDIENVRAAWKWALNRRDFAAVDGAVESLFWFCQMRSRFQDGVELLREARDQLAPGDGEEPHRVWGRILARWGQLQSQIPGWHEDARTNVEASLEIARRDENQAEVAFCLLALGYAHLPTHNNREALQYFEESLDAYRELDDRFYIAHALHRVGYGYATFGDIAAFMKFTRQGLDMARALGSKVDVAWCLSNLGAGSLNLGDLEGVERYSREAIALADEIGAHGEVAHAAVFVGLAAFLRGELASARGLAEQAVQIATDINILVSRAFALAVLSVILGVEGDYDTALRLGQESQSVPSNSIGVQLANWGLSIAACGLDDYDGARRHALSLLRAFARPLLPVLVTWPLPVLALLLAREGQRERAVELLGLTFSYRPDAAGWLEKWPLLARLRADLEAYLGAEVYAAAWERGKNQEIEAVINQLLDEYPDI